MIDENGNNTHDGDSSNEDNIRSSNTSNSSSSSGMKEQSLLQLNPSLRRYYCLLDYSSYNYTVF